MATAEKSFKTRLDSFNLDDYREYIPNVVMSQVEDFVSNQKYGWRRRGSKILQIHDAFQRAKVLQDELVEVCNTERSHKPVSEQAREKLHTWIESLSEEKLQELAEKNDVSYESFKGDKANLVEAILDEMLSTLVE